MPTIDVGVECPVFRSFRVEQVAGMFDVPLAARAAERFSLQVPDDFREAQWRIGLVVGPSGSGKTTIARALFGEQLYQCREWPRDRAVIDGLGDRPIKEITGLFTAVGFSSPPSWIKPYQVLSGGEQFRCDLARALALAQAGGRRKDEGGKMKEDGAGREDEPGVKIANRKLETQVAAPPSAVSPPPSAGHPLGGLPPSDVVAFDEFTSVVDRNVARAASAAIARGFQKGQLGGRFVAVTCHYDVTEWLQPDWVIDMATSSFQWRRLPRPPIELEVFRCARRAWPLFAHHHYLSGALSSVAWCFLALWEQSPVAFCAVVPLFGKKGRRRISRIVTLPDYQGIGIGMRLCETVAGLERSEGHRVNLTASHPAVLAHCRRSPRWRAVGVRKTGSQGCERYRGSAGRAVVSFEFLQ